jgi:hypothetical protein
VCAQSITETFDRTPLKDVIRRLEKNYRYQFSYVDQMVSGHTVTARFERASIGDVLSAMLAGTLLNYRVTGSHVIALFEDAGKLQVPAETPGSIRGIIVDAQTHEVLPAANAIVDQTPWGASADLNGRFQIVGLPAGDYVIRIQVIGYETLFQGVAVRGETELDTLPLVPKSLEGEEVIITGLRTSEYQVGDVKLDLQPGLIVLNRVQINRSPGLLEPDLFRTLQSLPGITTTSDASNEIYVRGGTPDQNLIMLDRTIVYQPYHLFGVAGIFNPDIIDEVFVSTGGFSSEYGNRMSSVIDIRSRNGGPDKIRGSGSVSLLSSKLALLGRLDPKWDYVASYRRTYLDLATKLVRELGVIPDYIPYYFHDGYAKVTHRRSGHAAFGVSAFFSEDRFDYTTDQNAVYDPIPGNPFQGVKTHYLVDANRFAWGNLNLTAFWKFGNAENALHQLTVFRAHTMYDLDQDEKWRATSAATDSIRRVVDSLNQYNDAHPFDARNHLTDYTLRWDSEIRWAKGQWFIGGQASAIDVSYRWKNLNWGIDQPVQVFYDGAPDSFTYAGKSKYGAFYTDVSWELGDWLVQPGLRLEYFRHRDPEWVISPRFLARWDMSNTWALKASGGLYYQSHFTVRERGYGGFSEVSFAPHGLPPQKSFQYAVGAEFSGLPKWKMTATTYFKKFDNLFRIPRPSTGLLEFQKGKSISAGLEFTATTARDRWGLQAAYTLAYVDRRFNGTYFPNYDQRHTVILSGYRKLPKNWELNFRWSFNTGRAYRPINFYGIEASFDDYNREFYVDQGEIDELNLGHLNFYSRMPVYHRLDVSFIRTVHYRSWTLKPFINILNVYYRTNPQFYYTDSKLSAVITDEPIPRRLYERRSRGFGLPIVPTFGASFEF